MIRKQQSNENMNPKRKKYKKTTNPKKINQKPVFHRNSKSKVNPISKKCHNNKNNNKRKDKSKLDSMKNR